MIRIHILLAALVLTLAAPPLSGQQPPSVSLEDALLRFAERNLELRLSRSLADQAAGLASQAEAFPNPSLNATHEPLSGDAGSYSETYLTASQRFEISGARSARSEAGERRSQAAAHQLRADSLRLAFDVKRTYVQALLAQERHAVTERIVEIFREAARSATERYESGDVSRYALQRIRVERARYETLLADADLDIGSAQRTLALLIAPAEGPARLAAAPLPTQTPTEVPEGTLNLTAVEGRAELAAARATVDAEVAQARLTRAERIPDVTATAGFKRQSDGRRGAFLGLSLPVPLFDRGTGAVEAATAGLRAAEERLVLTRRQLENDVLRAIESYETFQRRSQLLSEDDMGDPDDLLDMALVAYAEGEMELVELLDAADALHEARTAELSLRAAFWTAYFDLERALGGFAVTPSQEGVQ